MKTAVRADIEKLSERLQIKSSFSESFLASGYFSETRLKGEPADFNETILQVFVLRAFFLIPRIRTIKLLQKRDIRPGGLRQLDTFLENIGADIIAVPVGFRPHPVR